MKKILLSPYFWVAVVVAFNTWVFNPINNKFPKLSWLLTSLYFGILLVLCVVIILIERNKNKKWGYTMKTFFKIFIPIFVLLFVFGYINGIFPHLFWIWVILYIGIIVIYIIFARYQEKKRRKKWKKFIMGLWDCCNRYALQYFDFLLP